jgi:uncharacterized damage-inducible protein DinB
MCPMTIAQILLPEFEHEMKSTRAMLASIPAGKAAWRPHAKSWTVSDLAMHIANLVNWTVMVVKQTELDLDPASGSGRDPRRFVTVELLLKEFDASVHAAREAISGASDADLKTPWSLKNAGQAVFTMPRISCLRFFVMNHVIHHRGQLSVYLRLCEVPLPSVYGPTADSTK